ncbi:hypothetical protein BDN72DRAFT_895187 [Pluteus cervinus]|uniref:Uncharacterized protein n=1 Tax=Pluteus cervinus TaxID=181527 RepID=A0ACD3B1T8_9AGAR|nr:hypothetical protein BDN72DRAFT_895187 [Pluteus cervinus]
MYRIQHLRLTAICLDSEVEELLVQVAPNLTSFELNDCQLPSTPAFSGIHPRLQHLTLKNVAFLTPSSLITPNMTMLHIVRPMYPIHVDYLISLLPSLPNLTELAFVLCLASEDVVPPPQRLSLPSLQVLSLTEGRYNIVFGFLGCLDISRAAITVVCPGEFGWEMTDTDMDNFWTGFELLLREAQITLPIRRLELNRNHPNYTIDISSSPSQPQNSFQFPHQGLDDEATFTFISTIPLLDLETLIINDLPEDTLDYVIASTKLRSVTAPTGDHSLSCGQRAHHLRD